MVDVLVARGVLLPLPLVGFPARAQHKESCSARISVRIHASTRNTSNVIYNLQYEQYLQYKLRARKQDHHRALACGWEQSVCTQHCFVQDSQSALCIVQSTAMSPNVKKTLSVNSASFMSCANV